MARGFRRTRHGLRARLDDGERAVLAHLFVEVYELLDDGTQTDPDPLAALVGIGTAVDLPDDPALARLLPDAHKDDPDASSEFRRYTEQGLRERKRQCLETARLTLGREGALTLDVAEAQAWLVSLTDVRLVLAERMGLRTEDDHERLMRGLGIALDGDPDEMDEFEPGVDEDAVDQDEIGADEHDAGARERFGQARSETLGADDPRPGPWPADADADPGQLADERDADLPTSDDEPLDDVAAAQLATMLSLYDFLTWMQETLVQAVTDD